MARNKIASKEAVVVDGEYVGASFTFADGQKLTIGLDELKDSIKTRLIIHGLLQKIGDSYSGLTNISEAFESAKSVVQGLIRGDWSTRSETGGMLLDALIEYFAGQQSEEEVRAKFAEMDADKKKALKAHPKIKVIIARMTAERAAKAAEDSDDLEI